MKQRIRIVNLWAFAVAVAGPAVALVGCVQSYDKNVTSNSGVAQVGQDAAPVAQLDEDGGCPVGAVCSPPTTQCAQDSPECFFLCGSPSCALADAAIPPELAVPPIYLPNGQTTTDPCEAVENAALAIRQASCAPCHTGQAPAPPSGFGNLNFILNDAMLVASVSPTYQLADGGPRPYLVPGHPADSFIYQRVVAGPNGGGMPPATGLCYSDIGPEAGANVAYPTASDLSVLYAWILNCIDGASDGGAYSSSYYGGCFGPCAEAGATK